ncbi:MipA/OmpV family protein [Roseateles aquatilis]|nr:MipA/OmpV family protein [Roseateles aquatilis]
MNRFVCLRRLGALSAMGLGLGLSVTAQAQVFGWVPAQAEPDRWALGGAVAVRQRPFVGVERKTNVLPVLMYESRWFRVAGAGAELKLWRLDTSPKQTLDVGLRLGYDDEGYKASDSPRLGGMAKRKGSFWGGPAVTWETPWAHLSADWMTDLSGNSKGQKLQLGVEHRMRWGALGVTPRVRAQWSDRKVVDYYYGVRADEVRVDRAAYAGKSAFQVEAGLRVDYALAGRHGVFMDLGVTRLPSAVTDSPIVDRRSVSRAIVGYMYRF